MPTTNDDTNATDPTAPACASISRAPLTCRQALAALLHELSLNSDRAYPSSSLKIATRDAYVALGEVGQ